MGEACSSGVPGLFPTSPLPTRSSQPHAHWVWRTVQLKARTRWWWTEPEQAQTNGTHLTCFYSLPLTVRLKYS